MRKREALLAEQRVAAVARPERPDLARLGKVDDVLLRVARPGHVLLAVGQRRAHGVDAGDDALLGLLNLSISSKTCCPMRAMMRMLTTTYGESVSCTPICDIGRADRAHAEREHVHRAALHRAAERDPSGASSHLERIFPVVGRPRGVLRERTDERAILDARHVARIRPRVVAARPQVLVELDECAGLHHLRAQRVVLVLGAVHPMDGGRLSEGGCFFNPADEVLVSREGFGRDVSRSRS